MALVRTIIAAGESYYAEFKSAWAFGPEGKTPRDIKEVAKDIGEAVVAFGNSDGGDLLVGVEDSGSVTGLPWDGDKLNYLAQAPHHQVKGENLGVLVSRVVLDGHTVLLFRVPEHAEILVTSSGRCLWRKGAASEPVPPVEIERRRAHRLGDTAYEAQPVPGATLEDLDFSELQDRLRVDRPHLSKFLAEGDLPGLLRYWNLLDARNGSIVLRRAALLLFAREPLKWHPNNRLRIRRVQGTSEGFGRDLGTREMDVAGPILHILDVGIGTLRQRLQVDAKQESLFTTRQLLPLEAVQECVVNAAAHRNYAIQGNAIEVLIFPDRVEFKSPGKLPEPLTLGDLKLQRGVHRSRNPLVMRVLSRLLKIA